MNAGMAELDSMSVASSTGEEMHANGSTDGVEPRPTDAEPKFETVVSRQRKCSGCSIEQLLNHKLKSRQGLRFVRASAVRTDEGMAESSRRLNESTASKSAPKHSLSVSHACDCCFKRSKKESNSEDRTIMFDDSEYRKMPPSLPVSLVWRHILSFLHSDEILSIFQLQPALARHLLLKEMFCGDCGQKFNGTLTLDQVCAKMEDEGVDSRAFRERLVKQSIIPFPMDRDGPGAEDIVIYLAKDEVYSSFWEMLRRCESCQNAFQENREMAQKEYVRCGSCEEFQEWDIFVYCISCGHAYGCNDCTFDSYEVAVCDGPECIAPSYCLESPGFCFYEVGGSGCARGCVIFCGECWETRDPPGRCVDCTVPFCDQCYEDSSPRCVCCHGLVCDCCQEDPEEGFHCECCGDVFCSDCFKSMVKKVNSFE